MADPRRILVVDIGATNTLLTVRSIADLEAGWQSGVDVARAATERDPAKLVDWVAAEAASLLPSGTNVVAIGVAAPGPLDPSTGVVTRSSNLGWRNVPLGPLLQQRISAPVALEDDAKAAALGEWRFGAGGEADPFAYLTISSGVGGGVIVGGSIVRGASGNAGEVGHIVIDPDGPPCACGRRGDIESFAGGAALARRALTTWPTASHGSDDPPPRTAAEVFEWAHKGDILATGIIEEATTASAAALAAISAVIEPERIVVGGAIALGQERMLERAVALARQRVMAENGRSMEVVPAALGDESVLAGMATLAQRSAGPR